VGEGYIYNDSSISGDFNVQNQSTDFLPLWFWLLIILAVVILGYFVYKHIYRILMRRWQLDLTKDWIMYKIVVPKEAHAGEDDQRKNFQEMLAVIEPFYANLNAVFQESVVKKVKGQDHISLEIIAKDGRIHFFVGCPKRISEIVIRNLYAQYPNAEITPNDDFSIFPEKSLNVEIATTRFIKKFFLPVKTYKHLEEDPLNAITNSLSKLNQDELAAIQLVIRPASPLWRLSAEKAVANLQQGKSRSLYSGTKWTRASESFFSFLGFVGQTAMGKKDEQNNITNLPKVTPVQENQIKLVGEKIGKIGFETQIRIVGVSAKPQVARQVTRNIFSAFSQFNFPDSNGFALSYPKAKNDEIIHYILRIFSPGRRMILNTEELASLFHLPNRYVETPNIAWLLSRREPPPANLSSEGTILGKSNYRGEVKLVRLKPEDRLRHIYMIGKTGVGKTVEFQNMIIQDIQEGKGVCYLDPNGDAAEFILRHIPKERADDVIYFDPSDIERPFGLNMLEWKTIEQRDFLVQEAIQIFYKLFDPNQTGMVGPQFEHWMRNAALTLMSHPDGGTVIDVPRLFTDPDFEKDRVQYVTDPVVKSFWEKQMAKTADFHKSEMLNYFTSKFGRFMTNDMVRNIIGQTQSSFDFRDVMDTKKILICNLSKGKIGEINAFLLGMIMVSKLAMGAFSRQDLEEKDRVPFYLYVDEFQNFITDVFATILSESRKYKLSLNITNQYISQLDDKVRNAVIGNAGTLISFRIGAADAEFLIKEFDPLKIDDMTNIDKFNCYAKMLIDGAPTRPFNLQTIWPDNPEGNVKLGSAIKELSRLKYGRPKDEVAEEILERSKVDVIDLPGLSTSTAAPTR
jgi:hypothetical protein